MDAIINRKKCVALICEFDCDLLPCYYRVHVFCLVSSLLCIELPVKLDEGEACPQCSLVCTFGDFLPRKWLKAEFIYLFIVSG